MQRFLRSRQMTSMLFSMLCSIARSSKLIKPMSNICALLCNICLLVVGSHTLDIRRRERRKAWIWQMTSMRIGIGIGMPCR